MLKKLSCIPALGVIVLLAPTPTAIAQSPTVHTVSTIRNDGQLLLAHVKVNGKGPYEFLIDTASAMTLIDGTLYRELGLGGAELMRPRGPEQEASSVITSTNSVEMGGARRENIQVAGVENLAIGDGKRHIRGVLGENFLRNYDLLIDNLHQMVMLDEGSNLLNLYGGEHLPLAAGHGDIRPAIQVSVNSFDPKPLRLVLNSGTNALGIYPEKGAEWKVRAVANAKRSGARSGNEIRRCTTWKDGLDFGQKRINSVDVYACDGVTQEQADVQGNLPTSIFDGILISHSQSFLIINPVKQENEAMAGANAFIAGR